jgi:peptidoglycan-associated lipoprotein
MKSVRVFNFLVAVLLFATAAAGCKKNPKNVTPIPNPRTSGMSDEPPGGKLFGPGGGLGNDNPSSRNLPGTNPGDVAAPIEGTEDRATFASQTIYFDFDRSAIKASEQGKLDSVAAGFKSQPPGSQLRIEGNCDERGTSEYNRALGERRAIAARDYLIQKHGIESSRITTLSNGEDKPVDVGKTEEAYQKNRRDEFVLIRPR